MEDGKKLAKTAKKQQTTYNHYNSEQKLLFINYNEVKLYSVAESGGLAGRIIERTAKK